MESFSAVVYVGLSDLMVAVSFEVGFAIWPVPYSTAGLLESKEPSKDSDSRDNSIVQFLLALVFRRLVYVSATESSSSLLDTFKMTVGSDMGDEELGR